MIGKYNSILHGASNFANNGQFEKAANYILHQLKISPNQVDKIDNDLKKLAYLAAKYFEKASIYEPAIEIYLSLGERNKAAGCLEKNGDILNAQKVREGRLGKIDSLSKGNQAVGGQSISKYTAQRFEQEGNFELAIKTYVQLRMYADAARLLKKGGRIAEAANMFAEAGSAFDAAVCFLEIGDTGKGLDNLIRVPRDHKNYRLAAIKAISLALELDIMTFQIDNFLAEFIRSAPIDKREKDALYYLATLYETHDFLDNAKEVLQKLVDVDSSFKDSKPRLERVQRFSNPSAAVYEKIRSQEAGYRGEQRRINPKQMIQDLSNQSLPDLPPLPDLPDLNMPVSSKGGTVNAMPAANPNIEIDDEKGFEVGNTIAKRYIIKAEIGRGGMATVYEAYDKELDEEIALKVFLTPLNDPSIIEESMARFKQELKLSRKLVHKNIISLYDIGIHNSLRYISMELLQGDDLEHKLEQHKGPYDFAAGIHHMLQACAGLNTAHEMGVVHRDIKPENLFISDDGNLKVMDFGIAKNTFKPGMTVDGMLAGTPHYIAPEQISSFSKVTHLADLYSLGIVMYKMFTQTLPFDNDDMTKLLMMHINDKPRSPREINPNIPKELEFVIMKLMEKNPANRFADTKQTAGYLQEAYRRITR